MCTGKTGQGYCEDHLLAAIGGGDDVELTAAPERGDRVGVERDIDDAPHRQAGSDRLGSASVSFIEPVGNAAGQIETEGQHQRTIDRNGIVAIGEFNAEDPLASFATYLCL